MSQPFHYPHPEEFKDVVRKLHAFTDAAELFMRTRGMAKEDVWAAMDPVHVATEGDLATILLGLLTNEEKRPVNSFTGKPW